MVRSGHYILVNREPVACDDLLTWARWCSPENKRVARTQDGDILVSTVFLASDHNFDDSGPPILFETMVFGGPLDGDCERYCTWDEAEEGHRKMVRAVTVAVLESQQHG